MEGRYSYKNQPVIVHWNLYQLANQLFPLIKDADVLRSCLDEYKGLFFEYHREIFSKKFGVEIEAEDFSNFLEKTLVLLEDLEMDFPIFFQLISHVENFDEESFQIKDSVFVQSSYNEGKVANRAESISSFRESYRLLVEKKNQKFPDFALMQKHNPRYVLRNWMLQRAVETVEKEDFSVLRKLEMIIANPWQRNPELEEFFVKTPKEYEGELKFCKLSCSS